MSQFLGDITVEADQLQAHTPGGPITSTSPVQFSGTTHAGLKVNSLTTVQRDALTPANGMVIYNSTLNQIQRYGNGAWANFDPTATSGAYLPADSSLLATNIDPALCVATSAVLGVNGTIYLMRLRTDVNITVTNIIVGMITVGATLTSGQNFAALYNSSKTLLAASADQSAAWASGTGTKTIALTAAQAVPAGYFYVGLWSNGTTRPAFMRGNAVSVVNAAATGDSLRWAVADTSVTTTSPSPLGALTAANNTYWVGVS